MKKLMFTVALVLQVGALGLQIQAQDSLVVVEPDSVSMIEVEYDLIVFEPGFEMFLMSQPPMDYYSTSYYRNWNIHYVQEWNIRSTSNRLVGVYQERIDYNPHVEYGIELEYKLYYFFRFIEDKYKITLIPRGR